jgi:hypothetical protein
MLEIKDHATQASLLIQVIAAIESGQTDALSDLGLAGPSLDTLRDLRAYELVRLLGRNLGFSLALNANQLMHEVRALQDQISRQLALEFFITKGAPTNLIQRLFHLPRDEVKGLAKAMNQSVRPSQVSNAKRAQIEAQWLELRRVHATGSKDHWMALAQAFPDLTLATLHNVIVAFERLGQ